MKVGALLAALLVAGAGPPESPSRLPPRVEVRYRVELAGEHVGWARLAISCAPSGCDAVWESALRAPDEAGGGLLTRRIEIEAGQDGAARRGRLRAAADGREREVEVAGRAIPATFAEILLSGAREGERRCVAVRDEESGREGEACARRSGAWLEGETLGEPVRFRSLPGEAPSEVLVPSQRARFVADPLAALPARAPALSGTVVASPKPPCWASRDAPPPPAPPVVPRAFPKGASCRERTARYLASAAEAGLRGRHAVGIAFDGAALVWHEWAELLVGSRWIPVDPSFEQAPAKGPRYTLARYEDDDPAARAEAGRRILACWGR